VPADVDMVALHPNTNTNTNTNPSPSPSPSTSPNQVALHAAIGAARGAGVRTEDVSAATFKLAQARRWGKASDGLAAALAQPTTESEASLAPLRASVVEARAVGLPPDALEAAAAQLERSEAVVTEARRREAVRRVALPPLPLPLPLALEPTAPNPPPLTHHP
jgi:hypothetical protein